MAETDVQRENGQRLYGPPMAETLYLDLDEAWDATDGDEVEEHTVHPPRHHLPDAARVAEWIAEWAGENGELDEYGAEDFEDACMGPGGLAAVEACLDAIAALTNYRMADKVVATHRRPRDIEAPSESGRDARDG